MVMSLSQIFAASAEYLQMLYTDEMDILSTEEVEAEDGTTNNIYPKEPQQKNIPCRISLTSKDTPSPVNESVQNARVESNPIIHCSKDVQVKARDRITVRRKDGEGKVYETYTGLLAETGRPNKWMTHQEISIVIAGDA